MVAESKYSQLAGHQLLRPREVPPVGTPAIQGGAYISNSRSFHDTTPSSFFRGDQGLNNGPTKFTSSRSPQFSRSLTHSVRGRGRGRGGGKGAAYSSRPYRTPSTRTTSRTLSGAFEEEKSSRKQFVSSFARRTPFALTPSEHEMALSYPTLESQLINQKSSQDLFEQKDDFRGPPRTHTRVHRAPLSLRATKTSNIQTWRTKTLSGESKSWSTIWRWQGHKQRRFSNSWTT